MLASLGVFAVFGTLSQLRTFPAGLRLIDGPICKGQPYNVSHCIEETPVAPLDLVLIRTVSLAAAPEPCPNGSLVLPPPIAEYAPLANRIWRSLHGSTPHCWTIGTYSPSTAADPLLAYVDPAKLVLMLNQDLLAQIPKSASPTVVRYYQVRSLETAGRPTGILKFQGAGKKPYNLTCCVSTHAHPT